MKKALHITKIILVWLLVILAVCMMIFTVVSSLTFGRTDRDIFGYKAFIVLSDSMSATDFDAGDLVLVKEVDPATLQVGDIIAYQSTNTENYGEVVTHKIRELTTDANGNPGFITYGTTTNQNDENVVTYSFVLGKYQTSLPGVGTFFQFLKTTPGYIVCIFLPFLVLILIQGVNSIRLFRRYKQEQLAEIAAEREQQKQELAQERERLEAQQAESQKMMAELLKLKNELSAKDAVEAAPQDTADAPVQKDGESASAGEGTAGKQDSSGKGDTAAP